ncbi:MAG TPA: hypothetical protein VF893_01125 [Candidatus Bathyarchaeia archaeon]
MSEEVLNLGENAAAEPSYVQRTTDPVILPQPYVTPTDFAAQYPTPLDPTEIINMCEEINLWRSLPEMTTQLNAETWRELNVLAFTSGSNYIAFADGECPEAYAHGGDNFTVYLKNIGAKKTLSYRDIMHSGAVAGANWNGINTLVGGYPTGEGLPGGGTAPTFSREHIANVKEKEVRLAMTLVLNGWDRLLVQGDATTRPLEFDGIENWAANRTCTFHTNVNTASGAFAGVDFDRFLSETCAKPTHVLGHPQAIQEMMSAYFQLGFAGSQAIEFNNGERIIPGYNFAGFVNTGVGRLIAIADANFRRTAAGATIFQGDLWPMRFTHNGEPLVYKLTQVPLSLTDLTPGCTAVSFEVWAATTLVIKACCAQGKYTTQFTGRIVTTCTRIV